MKAAPVVACGAVLLAATARTEEPRSPARSAVLALIDAQVAAWNRADLDAFCSVYADDALFLTPSGETRGRQAVLERYRKRYPDREAMGSLKIEPVEVRLLPTPSEAKTVTVAARWTLTYPNKPASTGHTLLVFRPRGSSWEIVQDASM